MSETHRTVRSASDQGGNPSAHTVHRRLRAEIKREWSDLWDMRLEDKYTAEDVARRRYELLFIDRGTIIKATRDYKPPDLAEILAENERLLGVRLTHPNSTVGGWRKFARDTLSRQDRWRADARRAASSSANRNGPPKKGGRGWLHAR